MTDGSGASAYPPTVQPGIPRLGDIPYGWTRSPIGKHLIEERRPIKMDDDQTYDLVTVKRARGGVVKRETLEGRNISVKTQFEIHESDFLISKRQIVHGACGVVPRDLHGSTVSNEYSVLRVRPTIDLQFLKYLSHSVHFQQTCFHSSIGVHIEKMIFKLDQWFKWKFDLPPIDEQRRIAEILGTWDRAIETTEKLIAASEAQKKALMQQLLTGKKRLPGFEGEWREVQLGELGETFGGLSGKSKDDFGSGKPYIQYKNVFDNSAVDLTDLDLVKIGAAEKQHTVTHGDILFTTSSEVAQEVGMSSVVLNPPRGTYLNSFCFGFRPYEANSIVPEYAKHYFRGAEARRQISSLAQGSTRYNLSKRELLKRTFLLPPVEEQAAIALAIESAACAEQNLRLKLQTLKTEKAALMQQLLTGKRRVNTKEMAA